MKLSQAEREFHRRAATACFNRAWEYLEKRKRSQMDEREMLNLVHASRYHWGLVGTPRNRAVGDWQVSRAYAELGDERLALQFAMASLETCKTNGLQDVIHTSNEAVARAYAVARDNDKAQKYLDRARKHLQKLSLDDEERKIYSGQIRETQQMITNIRQSMLSASK